MVKKARGNGWRDKWFRTNDGPREVGPEVPLGWHLFEAHMTGCRKAERNSEQRTSYKDHLFEHLAKADQPERACWSAVFMYFREAVKEIVNKEVTAITFPEKSMERGRYVPYEENSGSAPQTQIEIAEIEGIAAQDGILWGMGVIEEHSDEDLRKFLSDDLLKYALGELNSREKLMIYFLQHEVTLNRIPFDNAAVQSAAGTKRFQVLYDDVKKLSEKLFQFSKSLLTTDKMIDSDVDTYECRLLVAMLLKVLLPEINKWAVAENLPQPPFFLGNK